MDLTLIGQLLGIAFACGLNLYVTVAALGILSRLELVDTLPAGLQGLEGLVIIGSALGLYLVEAVVDRVRHADSLWDAVHTFIRPPAAALLALGALWSQPVDIWLAGAGLAFLVALAAHGSKAGLRLALNARTHGRGTGWISTAEDLAAVALVVIALRFPSGALFVGGAALVVVAVVGPRLWRAFALGIRCLDAALRRFFGPPGWRDLHEIPADMRALLDEQPLGSAPPRGARAALYGIRGVGAYRNGWLIVTIDGPVFVYRARFRRRRVDLPRPEEVEVDRGAWADVVRVENEDAEYTLYLLKDGPAPELAIADLQPAAG